MRYNILVVLLVLLNIFSSCNGNDKSEVYRVHVVKYEEMDSILHNEQVRVKNAKTALNNALASENANDIDDCVFEYVNSLKLYNCAIKNTLDELTLGKPIKSIDKVKGVIYTSYEISINDFHYWNDVCEHNRSEISKYDK